MQHDKIPQNQDKLLEQAQKITELEVQLAQERARSKTLQDKAKLLDVVLDPVISTDTDLSTDVTHRKPQNELN